MEAAIRFSQNAPPGNEDQRFLRVDVAGRAFSLCQITKSNRNRVKYEVISTSTKVPTFRTFDWHPTNETLIAVGQSGGEATLLNIAEGYQDSTSFSVRSQRQCNAVALGSSNIIAVGLDKVRTDFCLNIWDISQRLPSGGSRNFSKNQTEPLHRLAGGEPISSLKFFNDEPQLLIAGVKGQFVRLYDLREPNSSNGLQFTTRCVHNLTVDIMDDNYFASCFPSTEPMVCIWDRRMASRSKTQPVSFSGISNSDLRQPEVSLEVKNVIANSSMIWSLRFSKSQRGCLGIMSSNGQLRVLNSAKEYTPSLKSPSNRHSSQPWHEAEPEDIYLDSAQDVTSPLDTTASSKEQVKRVVSFDFTTTRTKFGESRILLLTGEGELRMAELGPQPEPAALSTTGFLCKGTGFIHSPIIDTANETLAKSLDRVRRTAEPRNALRQAFKQSKQNKSSVLGYHADRRRMSSFANQCWNADLGFFEKGVIPDDLLKLISTARLRCEAGYLLDPIKNKTIAGDSQWLEAFWGWIDRANRISSNGNMIQDNVDLSYVGVYSIWMEEITKQSRLVGGSSIPVSSVIKNLAVRLNVPVRRLCQTEYRAHRQLCLHVAGLAWTHDELETTVRKLINGNQHTKAAAIALFANDEKLASSALRSRTSAQTHKMLAMALAGSKQRRRMATSTSASATDDCSTEGDGDWSDTIISLSQDLTDPYARAILAYVKSGDWSDVLEVESLPLKHRVGVAIRHLDDSDLTEYVGRVTRQVIETGDIEGIIMTGTGTAQGLGLLSSYTRVFGDLQTAILGLSVGGAAERFVVNTNERDVKAKRTMEAFRETYRSHIMYWGLKFDRVRFDVASSKALAKSPLHTLPRPKEQIRLVCTYCSGSLTQFPNNGLSSTAPSTPNVPQVPGGMRSIDMAKHPPTSEKAAIVGTVCPKCGQHLPRCGVCDLWLGAPDESYAKWYTSQGNQNNKPGVSTNGTPGQKNKQGNIDLAASMTNSVVTTIGPSSGPSTIRGASPPRDDEDAVDEDDEFELACKAEEKWQTAMQKFTVYCVTCGHGFHASHARLWFEGRNGRAGHRVCPVPGCECKCNG